MNSDSKKQANPKEIININNIFFEDSFIDLINSLNNSIKDLYRNSKHLITTSQKSLFQFDSTISILLSLSNSNQFEIKTILDNLNKIKEDYNQLILGSSNNIEAFVEKAKKIFQEMKEQKDNKVEDIYNDYTRRHTLKNNNKLKISTEPIRKSNPLNEIKRNKTLNKNTNQNKNIVNINLVKNLLNKLGEFNNLIIKNHSNTEWENFNKIQKQILFEINKFKCIKKCR